MSGFPKIRWYRALSEVVSPRAFHVGFILVERFLFAGKSDCWATHDTLADLAKASPRTIRDALSELEEAGFLTHRRGGKGHANRYVPVLFDRQKIAGQNGEKEGFERQDSAAVDRQKTADERPIHRPEGAGWGPAPLTAGTSTTSEVLGVEHEIPPPDAALGGAGGDVVESTSAVSTVATLRADAEEIAARIDALEDELAEFRDADTGALADELPRVVRAFFVRDVDPSEAEFAEIDHAFRQWQAGDFVEPATLDEELAEFQRRRSLPDRDDREPDDAAHSAIDLRPSQPRRNNHA